MRFGCPNVTENGLYPNLLTGQLSTNGLNDRVINDTPVDGKDKNRKAPPYSEGPSVGMEYLIS
jgi:hypothetical protein